MFFSFTNKIKYTTELCTEIKIHGYEEDKHENDVEKSEYSDACFLEKFKAPPFYIETFLPVTVATQTFISENCKNDENMRRVFYIGPETT